MKTKDVKFRIEMSKAEKAVLNYEDRIIDALTDLNKDAF